MKTKIIVKKHTHKKKTTTKNKKKKQKKNNVATLTKNRFITNKWAVDDIYKELKRYHVQQKCFRSYVHNFCKLLL